MEEAIWTALALEGNNELLRKLHRIENKEPGFGTVIVPRYGFSQNDETHNMILRWLKGKGVNVWSPLNEIANLEYALRGRIDND